MGINFYKIFYFLLFLVVDLGCLYFLYRCIDIISLGIATENLSIVVAGGLFLLIFGWFAIFAIIISSYVVIMFLVEG